MVQHSVIEDLDHAGSFTIKLYQSEKVGDLTGIGEFLFVL